MNFATVKAVQAQEAGAAQSASYFPSISDGFVIAATLLGPIIAVQTQKWIERRNEAKSRKKQLFETLMASRGSRLSYEHVRALNMIEVTFYGKSDRSRTESEAAVLAAWREYLDFLSEPLDVWSVELGARREEQFINLLEKMAADIGYKFDRVQLRRGAYSPVAHGVHETKGEELRDAAIAVLTGERKIKVDLGDPAGSPSAVE